MGLVSNTANKWLIVRFIDFSLFFLLPSHVFSFSFEQTKLRKY